jgi:hypothetical protein
MPSGAFAGADVDSDYLKIRLRSRGCIPSPLWRNLLSRPVARLVTLSVENIADSNHEPTHQAGTVDRQYIPANCSRLPRGIKYEESSGFLQSCSFPSFDVLSSLPVAFGRNWKVAGESMSTDGISNPPVGKPLSDAATTDSLDSGHSSPHIANCNRTLPVTSTRILE